MSDLDVEMTGNAADEASEADAIVDGAETKTDDFTPPEGMEAELYENGSLSEEKIKARIDALKSEAETANNNAANMRKKLSTKGTVPSKMEEYADGYEPAEEYKQYYDNEDYKEDIAEVHNYLNKVAFENGMSKDQCKAVKDAFNKLVLNDGIVENDEQQKARNEEYIRTEKAKLGDNADAIITANVKFVKDFNVFNEAEKDLLMDFMDTKGAAAVNIINKIRLGHGGEFAGENIIPATGASGGLDSDTDLAREYYSKNTSDTRRQEIMMARIKAGRTGKLPSPEDI